MSQSRVSDTLVDTPDRKYRRSYRFTLNNWTEDDEACLRAYADTEEVKFLICGREIAPSTGTPHLQCYVYLGTPARRSWSSVKASLSRALGHDRCAIFTCEAGVRHNVNYCMKDNDYWTVGDVPTQGKRSDVDRLQDVMTGIQQDPVAPVFDHLEDDNTLILFKHYKVLNEYKAYAMQKCQVSNKQDFKVILCCGPSGSGKTKWISEHFPDAYWVTYGGYNQPTWYDGYEGQKTMVLDDFKGSLPYSELLRLADRYKQTLNVKGHTKKPALHTTLVISSLEGPDTWYDYSERNRNQREVDRRITLRMDFPLKDMEMYVDRDFNSPETIFLD